MDVRRAKGLQILLVVLLAVDLLVIYDEWRTTEQGQAFLARAHAKLERCAGCARRRQKLRAMVNHVHWDAQRIVEGEDVPTVPEP